MELVSHIAHSLLYLLAGNLDLHLPVCHHILVVCEEGHQHSASSVLTHCRCDIHIRTVSHHGLHLGAEINEILPCIKGIILRKRCSLIKVEKTVV